MPGIHVIGDSVLSNIPKSAHVSNNQAKICASAIIELLNGRQPVPVPIIGSTSYSATSDHTAGPIAVVMRWDPEQKAYIVNPRRRRIAGQRRTELRLQPGVVRDIWADTLS
jgi:sulfide dehydrogenase [flavocytochrome c] flavoprotein chain